MIIYHFLFVLRNSAFPLPPPLLKVSVGRAAAYLLYLNANVFLLDSPVQGRAGQASARPETDNAFLTSREE